MKITLDDWLTLEQQVRTVAATLDALSRRLITLMGKYRKGTHKEEALLLGRLLSRTDEAQYKLGASLYYLQSEWLGGDSTEPKNFTLREPNWVPVAHRFPVAQVAKYRHEATGELEIPNRYTTALLACRDATRLFEEIGRGVIASRASSWARAASTMRAVTSVHRTFSIDDPDAEAADDDAASK